MNALDLIILALAVLGGVVGWRLGLVARAASWIGLAVGLYLSVRLLPTAMAAFAVEDPSSRLIIAAALLLGGAFVGQGLGLLAGAHMYRLIPHGRARAVDRAAGAAVGLLGVVVAAWLLLPTMADVPGWPAAQARGSAIGDLLDDVGPRPPNTLHALRRLVGEGNFPRVFDSLRRAPAIGPPPEDAGIAPDVLARVTASTVKVEGEACRRVQEGSGFAVEPDVVVTNAHVVAGVRRPRVIRPAGAPLSALVVVFDSDRDLAVLHVPGLAQAPLPVGEGSEGQPGAVFGHPGGRDDLRIAPARITQQVEAIGRDLYDARQVRRDVFILAAALEPGDSGGPFVDQAGAVTAVAFAIAPDRPDTAYALSSEELRQTLAQPRAGEVGTGPCLTRA